MGDLKQYSGLTTKVKAMRSKLISKEEYLKLIEFETVPEIAEYLKGRSGFEKALQNTDVSQIHRETLEHAIIYSVYDDFEKIYKFANLNQRKYLKLHFVSYETELIKKAIRKSDDKYMTKEQDKLISSIFDKYSDIKFDDLFRADNIDDIINILQDTIYYEPLKRVWDYGSTSSFDYELALDMFCFKYIWKKRRINFSGSELKGMTDCFGTEADVLNITWIYRAKKFYRMTQSEIAATIIPIYHRIKKPQILKLMEINDLGELENAIRKTAYGRYFTHEIFKGMELDKMCKSIVNRVYSKYYRTEPYSMAVMSSYLRDKKSEMKKLITIVECIRYDYPRDAIVKEIL